MSNIPTAEEFLEANLGEELSMRGCSALVAKDLMIEFTKLHVEAALKEAAENIKMDSDPYHPEDEWVDRNSILNAYPLENIK